MSDIAQPARKKRRSKKSVVPAPIIDPVDATAAPAMPTSDVEVIASGTTDDPSALPSFNPEGGVIEIPHDDGTVTIQFAEPEKPKKKSSFDDNLADDIDPNELARIAEDLLEGIQQDDQSRSEWLQQRADGLDLLGIKVERASGGNVGSSATAVAGQSRVKDSILSEAIDLFQANAYAELCPASGPCKVTVVGDETPENEALAQALEDDFNFYLTGSGPDSAKEYYPDTNKMLWWTGYSSGMFKKVYNCPRRERPVSESVDGADLIVPPNVTDLANAGRITHVINMRQNMLRRMQYIGVYREVQLSAPSPSTNPVQDKEGVITGINPRPDREADQDYTLYECYCELDIPGFEHTRKGEPTGLARPYRVTIDKDSRVILEVRRNWREDDEREQAKIPFVAFPYTTNIGFYGTGLLQRLGNYSMALTAMLRESIDAGMFASFPGFLFAKPMGRQLQNEFRVPPGGGAPIDVSSTGNDINKAVMPLPYKDVSPALVGLMGQTRENAFRYGGMANTGVAEGKQNAPVGTTLAMIEQATKIEGGVHKALHAAQKQEFELLRELFREDPDALWRGNRRPAFGKNLEIRKAKFIAALENCELAPASDPNVASNMHRIAKANAMLQAATTAPPGVFSLPALKEIYREWAAMMKIESLSKLLDMPNPPQQPQLDPTIAAGLALKAREVAVKEQLAQVQAGKAAADAQNAQADRQSKESIASMQIAERAHAAASSNDGQQPMNPMDEIGRASCRERVCQYV